MIFALCLSNSLRGVDAWGDEIEEKEDENDPKVDA